ncbi:MAG: KamA family radical SAM protein [Deltaproteobacteria bacterium]|nr:MAG: KamA family radical SAM protein [Deltaproteobacteria bacterium]
MVHLPLAPSLAPGASLRRGDVSDAQWLDWRWQLGHMLTTAGELARVVALAPEELDGLAGSAHLFRIGITPYYASLMDPVHASCPIRLQAIPRAAETRIRDEEMRDPLGEDSHNPAPSVIHKYPDRVLFLVVDRCGIYCRHCNRRRLVGGDEPPTTADLEAGLDYIARTPRIRDVLLSGGDPLLLSTRRLDYLLGRLRAIRHVEILRIGTRLPVVCPMRIDGELTAALRRHHPLFVNTHFNHARELTPEARAACERLVDAGIPVGNQTVLLRGVNSSVRSLRALLRGLVRSRVRPYYLFQGDTVIGTDHLRTPVDAAMELYRGLRGWISGMCIPELVLDAPGGGGKVPIVPSYLEQLDADRAVVRSYRGERIEYPQPRERDCTVPYDDIYFAGVPADDDREGSAEAGGGRMPIGSPP